MTPRAQFTCFNASQSWPTAEDVLRNTVVPCLVYAGDADPACSDAREGAKLMPNATFVSLPGLDHLQAFERSDLILPHVKKFLVQVT